MKISLSSICMVSFLIFSSYLYSQCYRFPYPYSITLPNCENGTYQLVYEDNFDGNSLNLSKWGTQSWAQGSLIGNNHNQIYTLEPDNIEVSNGSLKIKANNQPKIRRAVDYLPDNDILEDGLPNLRTYDFSSSAIWSNQFFH